MTNAAKRLFDEAMKLPVDERRTLARELLESTQPATDEEAAARDLAELNATIEESYEDEAAGRIRDVYDAFPRLRSNS
jgi:hypothetical protein